MCVTGRGAHCLMRAAETSLLILDQPTSSPSYYRCVPTANPTPPLFSQPPRHSGADGPFQERIVCLNGAIDDTVSAAIVAQLLWLESDAPEKPITMYINSPGGEVSSGLAIYDTMNYIQSPVSTVCVGGAASMAAILLLGGEPGKRYALKHSSIMVHQPLGGTKGQASDIMIYAAQIQRLRAQINEIVRTHLNKAAGYDRYGIEMVNDMMERDKYLIADEAKEAGIIDEILLKRPASADKKDGEQGSE